MAARKISRLKARARLDRLVAMGFQKIVEELHIQLIIFDDQNFLGHFPATRATGFVA